MNLEFSNNVANIPGYTCAGCGMWVSSTAAHWCPGRFQQSLTWPQTTIIPGNSMDLKAFKGSCKLRDLPKDALVGDGYHVSDFEALFIRVDRGWLVMLTDD